MKALALVLALAAGASEKDEFYRGTHLERDGKTAEAAEVFRALAERSPGDPFADDALAELARLCEEKLGEPVKAAEAWELLLARYPNSRLAVRAARRAEFLRAAMGPGATSAATLAEFNEILYGFAGRPRAESIARMERLLAAHPEFPAAPRAAHWLGSLHLADGRLDAALARFREVVTRWPSSEWEPRARKGIADALVRRHDFDGAARELRALLGRGDPALDTVAREGLDDVWEERWRWRGYLASWAILAAFAAGMVVAARRAAGAWPAAGRALARPPVEVWYLLPVGALFVGAGLTEHSGLGHAITTIVVGALVVTWLSGATLEAARARAQGVRVARALAHVAASVAAIAALCYIAITRERLMDQLIETFKMGAER